MSSSTTDKYGVRKIYADRTGSAAQVFYVPEDTNPMDHPRIGFTDDGIISKDTATGAWIIDRNDPSGSCRLELYSESCSKKWLNVEITVYSYLIEDTCEDTEGISSYISHLYTRGGTHSGTRKCEGSAYKARLKRPDGGVSFTKEIQHDDYCTARSSPAPAQYLTECSGIHRFIGQKFIVYNMPFDSSIGRTPVKLEYYTDEAGMLKDGSFDTGRQNWRKLGETIDNGGWQECGDGSARDCPVIELGNTTGQRKCDEILNTGGGTDSPNGFVPCGNICVYRTDCIRSKIKWMSAREIAIPPTAP